MQELNTVVTSVMQNMIDSGKVEEMITAKMEKAVESVFDNMFRAYGDFGKGLEEGISSAVNIDFSTLKIPEYNLMIVQVLERLTCEHMEKEAEKAFVERLNKMLEPAPKEITTQGLIDLYLEHWRDEEDPRDLPEYATVEIEPWEYDFRNKNLKMWKQKDESRYSSSDVDLNLFIGKKGEIMIMRGDSRDNFGGTNYGPDAKVYQMYAAGTVITDIHTVDAGDLETWLLEEY